MIIIILNYLKNKYKKSKTNTSFRFQILKVITLNIARSSRNRRIEQIFRRIEQIFRQISEDKFDRNPLSSAVVDFEVFRCKGGSILIR